MHRKFIATIIAAALAVTAIGSAPARADDDALKALAAIAGIAIIGKVIHDRNKRKSEQHTVTRKSSSHSNGRVYDLKPRPLPQRANRRLLPGNCLRSVDTWDGRVRYFGKRCLERNYRHVDRLPQRCAVRFRGEDRSRRGYEARCLNRAGYKLARS
ncbi:hypothetical protein So717_09640 [Roseobacter cerasinus]|uniref:Uncharacterized protein n=1 Tax=Roseobacter cerasinus TaxID=2602289 RepID=A0A640VQ46_9RHOB|nr:hypothetical protein [Roseobacter cerasinus]GFE49211.1 hypothetical protein So717_09640 [Roseobacter cerasinus]